MSKPAKISLALSSRPRWFSKSVSSLGPLTFTAMLSLTSFRLPFAGIKTCLVEQAAESVTSSRIIASFGIDHPPGCEIAVVYRLVVVMNAIASSTEQSVGNERETNPADTRTMDCGAALRRIWKGCAETKLVSTPQGQSPVHIFNAPRRENGSLPRNV